MVLIPKAKHEKKFYDRDGKPIQVCPPWRFPSFEEFHEKITDIKNGGVWIDRYKSRIIYEALKKGDPLLFAGIPGTGKTKLSKKISEVLSTCHNFLPPLGGDIDDELFGRWNVAKQILNIEKVKIKKDKKTLAEAEDIYNTKNYETGELTKSLIEGGLFTIDEINRYDIKTQNKLLHVTQEKELYIPNVGIIKACSGKKDCNFNIIATANEDDIGTRPMSSALKRRFITIPFTNPPADIEKEIIKKAIAIPCEKTIDTVVEIANILREDSDIDNPPPTSIVIRTIEHLSKINPNICSINKIDQMNEKELQQMMILLSQSSSDYEEGLRSIKEWIKKQKEKEQKKTISEEEEEEEEIIEIDDED